LGPPISGSEEEFHRGVVVDGLRRAPDVPPHAPKGDTSAACPRPPQSTYVFSRAGNRGNFARGPASSTSAYTIVRPFPKLLRHRRGRLCRTYPEIMSGNVRIFELSPRRPPTPVHKVLKVRTPATILGDGGQVRLLQTHPHGPGDHSLRPGASGLAIRVPRPRTKDFQSVRPVWPAGHHRHGAGRVILKEDQENTAAWRGRLPDAP